MTAPVKRSDFLPANATKFETDLSETLGRIEDVSVPIDTLWSWDKCPLSHLPWLAWALSVDFWDASWPEHRKRNVCREAFEVHQLKGTLAGIRKYLEYADAELIASFTPPLEGFLGKLDDVFIDAWRESLPQIHIRPYISNSEDYTFYLDADFLDDGCISEYEIGEYIGRQAYYVHNGEEIELNWLDGAGPFSPDGLERFGLPTIANWGSFYLDDAFLDDDAFLTDEKEILAELVSLERAGLNHVLTAGYQATSAEPEQTPISYYAAPSELFLDDGFLDDAVFFGTELMPEFSEKYYLYIPEKFQKAPAEPFAYLDHTRFGFDEFTAELVVKITDTTDDRFCLFLDDGFLDEDCISNSDLTDFWDACDAVVASKSLRDVVLIDTAVLHQVTFGDQVPLGELVLGKYI